MADTIERSELESIAGLLGGLAAQTTRPAERKAYLLERLARLVGADAWVWVVQYLAGTKPAYYAVIDGGWENDRQKLDCLLSALSPEAEFLLRPVASRRSEHLTFARRDLIQDPDWYRCDFYRKHREPLGLDDLLLSVYPLGSHVQSLIRLHRRAGRAPFGEDECRRTHVVMAAVGWLHRAEVPLEVLPSLDGLPRRAREVLLLLLQGHSRKQVADELKLSEHTVADYSKDLHRRFQVHSRGQLLARFIPPLALLPDARD